MRFHFSVPNLNRRLLPVLTLLISILPGITFNFLHNKYLILLLLSPLETSPWWLPPLRACPLGYVEVRGCVPVDHLQPGSIRPIGHPLHNIQPQAPRSPPKPHPTPPPASPDTPSTPPPKECPAGSKWNSVYGGCLFSKSPAGKARNPKPPAPAQPGSPPPTGPKT